MRVATWNINGVRARIETATKWLEKSRPDIVCLQEIKCVDEAFPAEAFERLGYNLAIHGQKGFNGVALLSLLPLDEVRRGLPGDDGDPQSRYVEAVVSVPEGSLRVASIYLPNGNPPDTDKYVYKLAWMERLRRHAAGLLALEERTLLCGDYNIIPEPRDCHDPAVWAGDALFLPESRAAFRAITNLGWTDALRAVDDRDGRYTFWDYQAGARQRNWGIRIDHILASPQAADRIAGVEIEDEVRDWDKPSDHVPVVVELRI
ncbi:exodeoxyribonuclease III [Pleomorphomonas sp. JP5]|uniref:exodeoxyribonuclease III n=1 Tax=Pleomorphomonas sp. JP5 TaxID=2942998 RepID=UPI00204491FD|nr:exodeoxyribonuclease III [Pleomorphomonas sp. JP5]MCM5556201.1 exodeoxyribonuclease III [Pleomorphomonas sp. JP5]